MLSSPRKGNVMKTITQEQAYQMFLAGKQNEEELNKRYVICEKQENVETGWVRYAPKPSAKKFVVHVNETLQFPDPWSGNAFTLLAGGMLVDNGGGTVYGINPIEFYSTHSFA